MFNWFDLMRQAQANAALGALTQQFHLSGDQPQKIMAAFAPAFALGLQHALSSNDPSRLFQNMMSSGFQSFWQSPGVGLPSQAQQEGHRLLDQLFGSDEVSRRVAHQAAEYAGISAETMQQLMPLLAGIFAGGMSQVMMAQANAVQAYTAETMKETKEKANNPWAELWSAWLNAAAPEKKPSDNALEGMMKAFIPPAPAPKPEPPKEEPASAFNKMMEQGREMQKSYLASLQRIFQDSWTPEPKKKAPRKRSRK